MWREYVLGDHIKSTSGFAFSSAFFNDEEIGLPLIRIRDIDSSSTELHFSGEYSEHFVVENGDILIGMDGEFDVKRWKGDRALLNQRVLSLWAKASTELDLDFIYYWIAPYLKNVERRTAATTVKHLSAKDVDRAIVRAPILDAQRVIADILRTTDTAIEKTEALIAKYEQIKRGMMQDLFTRGLGEAGRLRPPPEEAPDLYHETELGLLPKGWATQRVGDIATVKGGKRLPAGREFSDYETPFPYLRVVDMVRGSIDKSDLRFVPSDIQPLIARYTISKLDLYITIAGTIGLVGHIPAELDGAQLTENAAKLCCIDFSNISLCYLKRIMSHDIVQNQIAKEIGTGGGVPKLALFRIEKLVLPIPPIREQRRIAIHLANAEKKLACEEKFSHALRTLKAGLMQDLLTGEVRVKSDTSVDKRSEAAA